MSNIAVPAAMLFATLGLVLGFTRARIAMISAVSALVIAFAVAVLPTTSIAGVPVLQLCWIAIIFMSLLVYRPLLLTTGTICASTIATGLIGGLLFAGAIKSAGLYAAPLGVMIAVPSSYAVARGYAVAPRVVMGWLLAVTLLAAILPYLVPHPGYIPDHRG